MKLYVKIYKIVFLLDVVYHLISYLLKDEESVVFSYPYFFLINGFEDKGFLLYGLIFFVIVWVLVSGIICSVVQPFNFDDETN